MPSAISNGNGTGTNHPTLSNQQMMQSDSTFQPPTLPPISVPTASLLNPPARFSTVCQNIYRASTQSLILLSNASSSSAKDRSARHSRAATTPISAQNFVNHSNSSSQSSLNNPIDFNLNQSFNSNINQNGHSALHHSSPIMGGLASKSSDEEILPAESSAPFLRTLKLRTILLLSPEHAPASLIGFCRKDDIHLVHVGLEGQVLDLPAQNGQPQRMGVMNHPTTNSSASSNDNNLTGGILGSSTPFPTTMITERMVKDGLEMLLDVRTHPILVLDDSGIHETGVLIGCLRKMMRWNFASIVVEYRSFAGSRARAANERFIEMFDTELITIPQRQFMPSWLAEDQEDQEIEFEFELDQD